MTITQVPNKSSPPQEATILPLTIDQNFLKKSQHQFNKNAVWLAVSFIIAFIFFTEKTRFAFWLFGGLIAVSLVAVLKPYLSFLKKRLRFIQTTRIPPQLWQNQELKSLNLTPAQKKLIEAGLKDFFILHALYPKKPLAMPSKMVDKLWHAFILNTQAYENYCKQAFGKLFHHIPDYQFSDRQRNIQMFTWQGACRIQGLKPGQPMTIPRLFAIDGVLLGTMAVGSAMWDSYQQRMAMQYQLWHAQTYSGSSCGNSTDNDNSKNDCDVGITSDGDCSCGGDGGGDGGSSCGGGCGGGD